MLELKKAAMFVAQQVYRLSIYSNLQGMFLLLTYCNEFVAMSMEAPLDRSTSIMTAAYSADI
jgi:hypothetical protein